eukprot:gnl/Chilomastix_cuspidata/3220.p1 GENE.gnl/Chilomastix_cuspidata/3220~~gnl/Chilomastix_cuspidata/3220.p1  ORF type:complete len:1738 (-),score=565.82 gnl/Chilomastix_cuspidata/3220:709-5631(-)
MSPFTLFEMCASTKTLTLHPESTQKRTERAKRASSSHLNTTSLTSFISLDALRIRKVPEIFLTGTLQLRAKLRVLELTDCRTGINHILCSGLEIEQQESMLKLENYELLDTEFHSALEERDASLNRKRRKGKHKHHAKTDPTDLPFGVDRYTVGDIIALFSWTGLEEVSFVGCDILFLDSSLALLPAVRSIDLRRNRIKSVQNLNESPKLTSLNLSFNEIRSLENINSVILGPVETLNLSYNTLKSTEGIASLLSLRTLDLRHNNISSFAEVEKLRGLLRLTRLFLAGNPIAVADNYRMRVLSLFVDWVVAAFDGKRAPFELDGKLTSKDEVHTCRELIRKTKPIVFGGVTIPSPYGDPWLVGKEKPAKDATEPDQNDQPNFVELRYDSLPRVYGHVMRFEADSAGEEESQSSRSRCLENAESLRQLFLRSPREFLSWRGSARPQELSAPHIQRPRVMTSLDQETDSVDPEELFMLTAKKLEKKWTRSLKGEKKKLERYGEDFLIYFTNAGEIELRLEKHASGEPLAAPDPYTRKLLEMESLPLFKLPPNMPDITTKDFLKDGLKLWVFVRVLNMNFRSGFWFPELLQFLDGLAESIPGMPSSMREATRTEAEYKEAVRERYELMYNAMTSAEQIEENILSDFVSTSLNANSSVAPANMFARDTITESVIEEMEMKNAQMVEAFSKTAKGAAGNSEEEEEESNSSNSDEITNQRRQSVRLLEALSDKELLSLRSSGSHRDRSKIGSYTAIDGVSVSPETSSSDSFEFGDIKHYQDGTNDAEGTPADDRADDGYNPVLKLFCLVVNGDPALSGSGKTGTMQQFEPRTLIFDTKEEVMIEADQKQNPIRTFPLSSFVTFLFPRMHCVDPLIYRCVVLVFHEFAIRDNTNFQETNPHLPEQPRRQIDFPEFVQSTVEDHVVSLPPQKPGDGGAHALSRSPSASEHKETTELAASRFMNAPYPGKYTFLSYFFSPSEETGSESSCLDLVAALAPSLVAKYVPPVDRTQPFWALCLKCSSTFRTFPNNGSLHCPHCCHEVGPSVFRTKNIIFREDNTIPVFDLNADFLIENELEMQRTERLSMALAGADADEAEEDEEESFNEIETSSEDSAGWGAFGSIHEKNRRAKAGAADSFERLPSAHSASDPYAACAACDFIVRRPNMLPTSTHTVFDRLAGQAIFDIDHSEGTNKGIVRDALKTAAVPAPVQRFLAKAHAGVDFTIRGNEQKKRRRPLDEEKEASVEGDESTEEEFNIDPDLSDDSPDDEEDQIDASMLPPGVSMHLDCVLRPRHGRGPYSWMQNDYEFLYSFLRTQVMKTDEKLVSFYVAGFSVYASQSNKEALRMGILLTDKNVTILEDPDFSRPPNHYTPLGGLFSMRYYAQMRRRRLRAPDKLKDRFTFTMNVKQKIPLEDIKCVRYGLAGQLVRLDLRSSPPLYFITRDPDASIDLISTLEGTVTAHYNALGVDPGPNEFEFVDDAITFVDAIRSHVLDSHPMKRIDGFATTEKERVRGFEYVRFSQVERPVEEYNPLDLPLVFLTITDRRILLISGLTAFFPPHRAYDIVTKNVFALEMGMWRETGALCSITVSNTNSRMFRLEFRGNAGNKGGARGPVQITRWFIYCQDWKHRARVVVQLWRAFPAVEPRLS